MSASLLNHTKCSFQLLNPVTYLQFDRLLPYLYKSITTQVEVANLINVYRYASHRDFHLSQMLWQLILKYFNKLAEAEEYLNLTPEELVTAMKDEMLNIESKMEKAVLGNYLAKYPNSPEVAQLGQKMKNMDDGFYFPVVMNRVPREILLAVGGWNNVGPSNILEIFNPRNERWARIQQFQDDRRAYHSLSRQGNTLYTCGGMNGREYFRTVRFFDMDKRVGLWPIYREDIFKEWGLLPDLLERRCYVNTVSIPFTDGSNQLMILGGYNGVERLSSCELVAPVIDGWRHVKNMTKPRSDGAAVLLGDGVMAVGGFDGRNVHQDGELYDVTTNAWSPLSRKMQHARTGTAATALNRHVVLVAGGFNGSARLATVEFYDTREGKWHALPRMHTTRSNFALEFMNGHVYAIGGFDGTSTTAHSEKFDMIGQRWIVRISTCLSPNEWPFQSMPELSMARSALKVVRLTDHDIIREMTGFDGGLSPSSR